MDIAIEKYTMILKHEYEFPDGTVSVIDPPVQTTFSSIDPDRSQSKRYVIINRMIEQMRDYLLKEVK